MTLALPAAPVPPPRRQVFVGTALASAAGFMLIGAMLGVWLLQRRNALETSGTWLPSSTEIPGVPSNVMLITAFTLLVFAQWGVYAARRHDRVHIGLALGITVVLALALINAQAFIYTQMDLGIADSGYAVMFYAITGTLMALTIIGLVFCLITLFRLLGGRSNEVELASAHALYWYVLSVSYAAVWLIVYVTK